MSTTAYVDSLRKYSLHPYPHILALQLMPEIPNRYYGKLPLLQMYHGFQEHDNSRYQFKQDVVPAASSTISSSNHFAGIIHLWFVLMALLFVNYATTTC